MSAKDIILKVKIEGANEELNNLNALQTEINALSEQKKQLNKATKELNDAIKAGTITEEQAAQKTAELAAEQVELNLITKETKKEYQEVEKALLNQGKAMDVAEGSIAAMRLELSKTQKQYINLSQAERENQLIGGEMQKQIKAQSDELKKLEKEIGITSRSVGDYGQALEGALPLMGGFGGQIQQVIGTVSQLKTVLTSLKVAILAQTATTEANTVATETNTVATEANTTAIIGGTGATQLFSKALRVFKVALAATGIGLLVIALGSMYAMLTKTQSGMDKLGRFMNAVGAVVNVTVQRFAAFGQGLWDLFSGIADVIESAFLAVTGDFTAAQKKYEEGSKKMAKATEEMGAAFDGYGKAVKKASQEAQKAYDLEQQRIKTAGKLKDRIAELNRESELSEEIEGNNTLSWNERTAAIIRSAKAQSEAAKLSAQLIQGEIDELKRKQQFEAETTESIQALKDKERELYEANTAAIIKGANIRKVANQLEQDLIEKNLDILIDGFDNQKTINERLISDEKRTFNFRKGLLEETKKLQQISLNNEVKEIEKTTDKKINVNDLIATSDAKVLNEKIRLLGLSEIMETRLLEVIRDNRTATNDLATADTELNESRIAFLNEVIAKTDELKIANIKNSKEQAIAEENLRYDREVAEIKSQILIADKDEELTNALNEKKKQIEIEHVKNIQDINIDSLKEQNDKEAKLLEISLLQQGTTREGIELALRENRILALQEEIELKKEINEEATEEELELARLKSEKLNEITAEQSEIEKQIKESGLQAIDSLAGAYFDSQNRRIDQSAKREIEALTLKKEAGLITQEEFEKQRLAIDKKAFEQKKRTSTREAIINGALAVTKAFATAGYPAGLVTAALAAIQTGIQVAAIQAQTFAKGGLLNGASHANGGIPISVGGSSIVEAEGGEAIINKRSTRMFAPVLSAINQAGGGVPIPSVSGLQRFANGGVLGGGASSTTMFDTQGLRDEIKRGVLDSIGSLKVVNVASETTGTASRVQQIQDLSTF
jgi:hypothetical protein